MYAVLRIPRPSKHKDLYSQLWKKNFKISFAENLRLTPPTHLLDVLQIPETHNGPVLALQRIRLQDPMVRRFPRSRQVNYFSRKEQDQPPATLNRGGRKDAL